MSDSRLTEDPVVSVGIEVARAIALGDSGMDVDVDGGGRNVAVGLQAEKTRLNGNRAQKAQGPRLMMPSFSGKLANGLEP